MDDKAVKNFLTSKTIWVNVIAVVVFLMQHKFGIVVDPEMQLAVLAVVNIGLRFITKEPIKW